MPVNAYSGDVGSGKTYSVVLHVIVKGVQAGRFIVTNIAGLDIPAIYEYALKTARPGKIICLGFIRVVDRNAPEAENFFPYDDEHVAECNVQPGEIVVIDEASRYWPMGGKMPEKHIRFINEHRHFVNEQGHTCDLVVIDPDVTELHRRLKSKIETTYYTKKPKEMGMTDYYVVHLFRKTNLRKPYHSELPQKYDKEVFKLYHSYTGGEGKEQAVDKRQNVLNSSRLRYKIGGMIAFILIFIIGGLWQASKFFNRGKEEAAKTEQAKTSPANNSQPPKAESKSPPASKWRLVGRYTRSGYPVFLLTDAEGNTRHYTPIPAANPNWNVTIKIDGEDVAAWTGSSKGFLK